jgi:LuxR family transcriptional regulator, maltose regulon positive regulatory protein
MGHKNQTKFWIRGLTEPLLERRAFTSLPCASRGGLVLLEAPAGYGKTHILAQWAERAAIEDHEVCWIRMKQSCTSGSHFLVRLVEALRACGVRASPAPLTDNPTQLQLEGCLQALQRKSIVNHRRKIFLVLDDYERSPDGSVERLLEEMFEELPANLVVAISTRQNCLVSVSQLLMQGRVNHVSRDLMLFSKPEAREFFGGQLTPSQFNHLYALTEGWPAALQMARICVPAWNKKYPDVRSVADFSRLLSTYCEDEIFGCLDPASIDMLTKCSVVQELEPGRCNMICRMEQSSRLLSDLVTNETILRPVDPKRYLWRLPRLVRQVLRRRAAAIGPQFLTEANLRAAEYFETQGDLHEAMHHYIQAGNPQSAAELLERETPLIVVSTRGDDYVIGLLGLLPPELLQEFPRLWLCQIYLNYKQGLLDEAVTLLSELRARTNDFTSDRAGGNNHQLKVESLYVDLPIRFYQSSSAPIEYLRSVEATLPVVSKCDPRLLGNFYLILGMLYYMRGDLASSETHFIQCEKLKARNPTAFTTMWLRFHFGSLLAARGNLHEAKHSLQAGLTLWKESFQRDLSYKALVSLALAEIDYEFDALSDAQLKLDESLYAAQHVEGWFDTYAALHEVAVMIQWHSGRNDELDALLARAVSIPRVGSALKTFLQILRLRIELFRGNLDAAQAIIEFHSVSDRWHSADFQDHFSFREWDLAGICLSLYEIKRGAYAKARSILDRLENVARLAERGWTVTKAIILRSVVAYNESDGGSSVNLAIQALERGRLHGYRRVFLDEGEFIIPVLELVTGRYKDQSAYHLVVYAASIVSALRKPAKSNRPNDSQLSERETEVLRDLSKGHSNKVIARRLELSEATINFHLRNIFQKLSVRKRASAVAEAHRRGWLDS